jgi:hypothetical protein
MIHVIASWFMACVLFIALVFFAQEGYWTFAAIDGLLCALFAWDCNRSLDRLESEVAK